MLDPTIDGGPPQPAPNHVFLAAWTIVRDFDQAFTGMDIA
jgi:hypothetical protein